MAKGFEEVIWVKLLAKILILWFAVSFCFTACWAVLMDKSRRRRQREDEERKLGTALLKTQGGIEIYRRPQSPETKVEPCCEHTIKLTE